MASAMGRLEALAYWVVSDHFEELGRPPTLLHGGFGLLSVGNLRKPRYWGMWMLQQLLDQRLSSSVEGDGAGDMVNALATRDGDGRLAILAWNGTVDVGKADGDPLLDRSLSITVSGLDHARYRLRRRGVDAVHSNIGLTWRRLADGQDWPDEAGWRALRQADRLEDLEWPRDVEAVGGELAIEFELPSPSVVLVEFSPLA
jgi:xylan 1,4-beta-xylosidase